jgi:hypothetical protein
MRDGCDPEPVLFCTLQPTPEERAGLSITPGSLHSWCASFPWHTSALVEVWTAPQPGRLLRRMGQRNAFPVLM